MPKDDARKSDVAACQRPFAGADLDAMLANHRKNLDALFHAGRLANEAAQLACHRQMDLLQAAIERMTAAAGSASMGWPSEADLALARLVSHSTQDLLGILLGRFCDSLGQTLRRVEAPHG